MKRLLLLGGAMCVACVSAVRIETGYAEVNDARLYWEAAGDGPVVVLLQGGQLPLAMWDDQFLEFAKEFRVIRYDVRGFGQSSPMKGPYAHRDDLHAFLQSHGIQRASLVGLSLGGGIAIDFAVLHPEMVEKLVVVGPGLSGFTWTEQRTAVQDSMMAAWKARDSARVSLLWLQTDYMRFAMRDSTLAARLRTLAVQNASNWMQPDSARPMEPPSIRRLTEIRAPTLVVLGNLDTPDIKSITDTLVQKIPGARRVIIADAGHMVNMEKPAEFTAAVLQFLRNTSR